MATISATSSGACAMIGDAPTASSPFAVVFMTTALVMLCTSGRVAADGGEHGGGRVLA